MTPHENRIAKELFKTYKISLVNYCIRKHKCPRDISEEFVAETFHRLTVNIDQVAYSAPAEQRSWLFSTLTNVISEYRRELKYISKDGIESVKEPLYGKDDCGQILEDVTYDKLINDIKSRLSDKEKVHFEKFMCGEYSYKELADSDGINYNTFKSQMLRISPKVRKIALEILEEHELSLNNLVDANSE